MALHSSERVSGSEKLPLRFVVFHIHPVSARLRFLKTDRNHLCLPNPLPALSDLVPAPVHDYKVLQHPGPFFTRCCNEWHLPEKHLKISKEFRLWVDTPVAQMPIYFLQVDMPQPFEAPEGMVWMELPDCFCLEGIEREILQGVYKWLLE